MTSPAAEDPLESRAVLDALDRMLFGASPLYTAGELSERTGLDPAVSERLWRAMGFTLAGPDELIFVDDDLKALLQAGKALSQGTSLSEVVFQTRTAAAALSRVAEVASDSIVEQVEQARRAGLAEAQVAALFEAERPELDRLMGYFYRRQLRAALWRKLAQPGEEGDRRATTVAFVDLVRFTAITEGIDEEALGQMVDHFETRSFERITDAGGRVVKMIGDAVMFVADDPAAAAVAALELVGDCAQDASVPEARAGLAYGPVLGHGGDYFGPVVNLAARIVDAARPSTVVTSAELRRRLRSRAELGWQRLPPRRLKGIGRRGRPTPLWRVQLAP